MKKIVLFLASGFEDCEVVATIDVVRRASLHIDVVSISNELLVKGSNGIVIKADYLLSEVDNNEYDGLIIPGGPGVSLLKANDKVIKTIQQFNQAKKQIGAICAGPIVLKHANILKDINITAHPSVQNVFEKIYFYDKASAVIDKNIITSKSIGTAIPFALAFVKKYLNQDQYEKLISSLIIKNEKAIKII